MVGAGGGNDERGGGDSTRWGVVDGSEPDSGSNDGSSNVALPDAWTYGDDSPSRRDALELEAWWREQGSFGSAPYGTGALKKTG